MRTARELTDAASVPAGSVPGPKRVVVAIVVAALAIVLLAADASACPNCKDAVNTADPDGLNMARGYFYSILIMLAMPFTLVASFGVYVWREFRRQERLAATAAEVLADGPAVAAAAVAPATSAARS